jgi:hypothetical protein
MNDNDEHMDECMDESDPIELVQIENSCPVLEELQNKISLLKIDCLNEIKQFLSENKCDELCLKFEKLTMDCTEILNKKFQKLNISELNSK